MIEQNPGLGLHYHHAEVSIHSPYGIVRQSKDVEDDFLRAHYHWLENEVGFYTLFFTVGETVDDIKMTVYQNQWSKRKNSN